MSHHQNSYARSVHNIPPCHICGNPFCETAGTSIPHAPTPARPDGCLSWHSCIHEQEAEKRAYYARCTARAGGATRPDGIDIPIRSLPPGIIVKPRESQVQYEIVRVNRTTATVVNPWRSTESTSSPTLTIPLDDLRWGLAGHRDGTYFHFITA